MNTLGGLFLITPLLVAFAEGALNIPGDGCLKAPPELDTSRRLMVRSTRQVRVNSTDPNLMSMTNLPYFSEIVDPLDPCYKYICYPMPRVSPFYAWVKRFNQDRCCRFEDQHISIGDFKSLTADEADNPFMEESSTHSCSQKIVRCKLPEFPHDPPETVVEVLPNAKCCLHEGRMISPGAMVLDPERCAMITCQESTAGVNFPGNKDLQITKVFEHACGCCVYEGRMVKDGDWLMSNGEALNITCMKGRLYHIEEFQYLKHTIDDDLDNHVYNGLALTPSTTPDGLLDLDLAKKEPLQPEDMIRCHSTCDPDKVLEPFLEKVNSLINQHQVNKIGLLLEQHNSYLNLVAQSLLAAVSPGPTDLRTFVTYYSHYCVHEEAEAVTERRSRYSPVLRTSEQPKSNDSVCNFGYSVDGLQNHPADCKLFNSWIKLLLMQDEPHQMQYWRRESVRMGLANVASNMKLHDEGKAMIVLFTEVPDTESIDQVMAHLPEDQVSLLTDISHSVFTLVNINENKLVFGVMDKGSKSLESSTILVERKADIDDFYECNLKCKCSQSKKDVMANQMRTFKAYKGAVKVNLKHGNKDSGVPFVEENVSINFRTALVQGGVCPANSGKPNGKGRRINFANPEDMRHKDGALGPFREIGDVLIPPKLKDLSGSKSYSGFDSMFGRSLQQASSSNEPPARMTMASRDEMIRNAQQADSFKTTSQFVVKDPAHSGSLQIEGSEDHLPIGLSSASSNTHTMSIGGMANAKGDDSGSGSGFPFGNSFSGPAIGGFNFEDLLKAQSQTKDIKHWQGQGGQMPPFMAGYNMPILMHNMASGKSNRDTHQKVRAHEERRESHLPQGSGNELAASGAGHEAEGSGSGGLTMEQLLKAHGEGKGRELGQGIMRPEPPQMSDFDQLEVRSERESSASGSLRDHDSGEMTSSEWEQTSHEVRVESREKEVSGDEASGSFETY